MPYKKGDLKGELTSSEIRKLIRAHNKLVSIKIPPKTDRDGLIKIVQDNGYKIDHKGQKIVDARKSRPRRVQVSLEQANKMTKKTDLDKQKAKEKREENLMKKKKEIRQIKKDAIKKEKEVQKKKKYIKDKIISNINNRKKKMPEISTQTEQPQKQKRVLKLPSQTPKKVSIDKSKKPPMNTKKIEPKKKEVKKEEEPKKKVEPKKEAPKKEAPKKEETQKDFTVSQLEELIENPKESFKSGSSNKLNLTRSEALYEVSKYLLNKNTSYKDFMTLIDALEMYDMEIGMGFGFSFGTGEAPPRWRKKLSKMVRDMWKASKHKPLYTEWIKSLPKKMVVSTDPIKRNTNVLKKYEEGFALAEQFLKDNKKWKKEKLPLSIVDDISSLKNKLEFFGDKGILKGYGSFLSGYNKIWRLEQQIKNGKITVDDELKEKIIKSRDKYRVLIQKLETGYKYRNNKKLLAQSNFFE
jgi:hypothetical protein